MTQFQNEKQKEAKKNQKCTFYVTKLILMIFGFQSDICILYVHMAESTFVYTKVAISPISMTRV
jgi:hypothetical protein